ncbi:MAG: amidohydrolase family protein [Ramlibacter sp.]|uniref:amidohydrolase family protein n=1 Tax=Ramlibacter sp. TaxID=1917967 RepID=UPI0026235A00|nr:amidohydrolase family protein [Ramlibacter sp.]MDH4376006.1 amidohydrolase family protein [Ramlibacter sp.]
MNHCCGLIDVHTHWIPEQFPAYVGARKGVAWPSMAPASHACDRHVMIEGKVYRTVPDTSWDPDKRAKEMAQMGVTHQVVSPMPELLSYWLAAEDALMLTRFMNEELASLQARHRKQLTCLGAVPLQDVDLAIRELERAVGDLGLAGVELGTNVNGKPLGHPDFQPFFAAAESLGAAIFVHALRPAGMDRLVGDGLEQVVAFPGEVGLSATSLLTSGLMARHPGLRIAFSHGGGALPMMLPRLQHAWTQMPPVRKLMNMSPRDMARKLFVDDLVYDRQTIQFLLATYGEGQVMAGTDYPFAILDKEPAKRIEDLSLDEATTRLLRQDNALRWLARTSLDE